MIQGEAMHVPVLIVGAGPVGLALAGDLGFRGIRCVVVEKSNGVLEQPKMDLVGVRTMEFCRRWGIAEWVGNSPYPRDYPQDYVYVTSLTGYELGREPFPALQDAVPPVQSPQKRERCPQDMFDPILKRFASSFEHVSFRYMSEMLELSDLGDYVSVTLRDGATGETEEVTADYVVGCDGAASSVRSSLDISMTGQPALTYTTNVIFRSEELPEIHDKGLAYRFICIGPEGTYATIVAINGGDRWRLSHIGNNEKKTLTPQEVDDLILRCVGRPFKYEVLSVVPWVRRELVADSYGRNRVFIAGDAAHMMSPTGGFGMNTGIGDAVDLSWKIAATLEGWGGAALLESYESERRQVAIRNVREATTNLQRMLSPRENLPSPAVFEPGPAGELARSVYGNWFEEIMRPEWFSIGIHLGYRYDDSPICVHDGTPAPPYPIESYEQTSRPGGRAPHVWLDQHTSTLDLFGKGFTLLRIGPEAPPAHHLITAARQANVPLVAHVLNHPAAVKSYGKRLILVRPDGHVAWRGNHEPENSSEIFAHITGHAHALTTLE
jgi:2-polyprenyl-6-methoxyphenol hydroxylase-like FAD-dependent oxidoreductase